jgi:nucleotide-binding universal stress UspA family protein
LLVAFDSPTSTAAVELLTHITWPAKTSIHILTGVPGYLPQMEPSGETRSPLEEEVELTRWREWAVAKSLTTQLTTLLRAHNLVVDTEICEGPLAEVVLEHSTALLANLLIIGTTGPGGPEAGGMGVVVQKLLDEATCPVLVVRPTVQVRPLSLILAVDDSPAAWRAVEFLRTLTLANWAKVTVLHVIETKAENLAEPSPAERPPPAGRPPLARQLAFGYPDTCATRVVRYLHNEGVQGRETIRFGQPTVEILGAAGEREAALIVMGAYSRTGSAPCRLGSVVQKVVEEASCSVLVVR